MGVPDGLLSGRFPIDLSPDRLVWFTAPRFVIQKRVPPFDMVANAGEVGHKGGGRYTMLTQAIANACKRFRRDEKLLQQVFVLRLLVERYEPLPFNVLVNGEPS